MKRLLSILLAAVMSFTVCTPFSACADYENPHPDWGNEINWGFITNYVADDGTVSAEITDNGITWLSTDTEGKTYYGLDNSYGTFEKGSRFWIRWVDSSETGGEPILLYAVESPEGEIHTEWFEPPISLYIQINDGWAAKEYEWTEEKVAAFAAGVSEHKNNYTIIDNYVLPDGTLSRVAKVGLSWFKSWYDGTATASQPQAEKSANTLKAKGKTVNVKRKRLKKKSVIIKRKNAITVKGAKGKLSYKKLKGVKKITVNKKTGAITLKKGLKKGTYRVKIKVTAAGNSKYKSAARKVTVKIKVN